MQFLASKKKMSRFVSNPMYAVCTPEDTIRSLNRGNRKFRRRQSKGVLIPECFVSGKKLSKGQAPWVAVLACADSRVPPEWVFNCAPGEMFVVRTAGNVSFDDAVASMEFAVNVLKVDHIVVMGHSSCGAVNAALGSKKGLTPALKKLVINIRKSVKGNPKLPKAIRQNTRGSARRLQSRSELLDTAVKEGRLTIKSAVFNIKSGKIKWL